MPIMHFESELAKKKNKAEMIAQKVVKNPEFVSVLIKGFLSNTADIKFKSAKALSLISKEKPKMLYLHFGFFTEQLNNKNNILKWHALDIIANLTIIDIKKKFDRLFYRYYRLLDEGSLITAGHVYAGSVVIVRSKPYLEPRITKELLKIEKIPLPTGECRNILKGQAIIAFEKYFKLIKNKTKIVNFVRKELRNRRRATGKKAEEFLKKWAGSTC